MAKIAIIDDNKDQSSTVRKNIVIALNDIESNLEVITSVPFKDPNSYFDFIEQNEVCVIILDEKLNDQANDESGPVAYKGSELVSFLRQRLPDFPIFALTVFSNDEDLNHKFDQYEDIISREDFYKNSAKYVPKFRRAAKNYLKENIDAVSEFNDLAKMIAGGNTDSDLLKRLQALQIKLDLPFAGFDDRNSWLNAYEEQIQSLDSLNAIIKSKLK